MGKCNKINDYKLFSACMLQFYGDLGYIAIILNFINVIILQLFTLCDILIIG